MAERPRGGRVRGPACRASVSSCVPPQSAGTPWPNTGVLGSPLPAGWAGPRYCLGTQGKGQPPEMPGCGGRPWPPGPPAPRPHPRVPRVRLALFAVGQRRPLWQRPGQTGAGWGQRRTPPGWGRGTPDRREGHGPAHATPRPSSRPPRSGRRGPGGLSARAGEAGPPHTGGPVGARPGSPPPRPGLCGPGQGLALTGGCGSRRGSSPSPGLGGAASSHPWVCSHQQRRVLFQ